MFFQRRQKNTWQDLHASPHRVRRRGETNIQIQSSCAFLLFGHFPNWRGRLPNAMPKKRVFFLGFFTHNQESQNSMGFVNKIKPTNKFYPALVVRYVFIKMILRMMAQLSTSGVSDHLFVRSILTLLDINFTRHLNDWCQLTCYENVKWDHPNTIAKGTIDLGMT